MSFAYLISDKGNIEICVVQYQLAFSSHIQTAQLRHGVVHYPIKVVQNDFVFQVQYRSQDEYQRAQSFITECARTALIPGVPNGGAVRLYWPNFGLDYSGYIKSSKMGAEKFDIAPKMTYTMQCLRDSISTPTLQFSTAPAFNSIYGKDIVSADAAITVDAAPPPLVNNNVPNTAAPAAAAPPPPAAPAPAPATPGNPFTPVGISWGPFGKVNLP